ncbi:MAG TPA: peptidoglycan-binding domain-containing protein [Pseudonocardia sp.]|nr:peptidoglycan-binding domain-containing protein [Pseudonocardia sp.]
MGVQRVPTGAQRPNGRSTPAVARSPVGLLQLQRAAGNTAVARLIAARQVVTAPAAPTRPIVRLGDIDQQVGVAQQKLNVRGATPELKIDAEFGSRTQLAVRKFQTANGVTPSGTLDVATWAQLDVAAPGGVLQPDGSVSPVPGLSPGDPTPQPHPGVPIHPTVKLTSHGPAVSELHEKLNAVGVGGGLPVGPALAGRSSRHPPASTGLWSRTGRPRPGLRPA